MIGSCRHPREGQNRRNTDLKYVLTAWQYEKYAGRSYFYRPLAWKNGSWTFTVYSHYSNKSHFYKARPTAYVSYKGGNNKKSDRFYADKKVNKPASTPTVKHGDYKTNDKPPDFVDASPKMAYGFL